MNQKIYRRIILLLFNITIFAFLIAFILIPDKNFSELENRDLQKMPNLSISSIKSGDFSSSFQNYISDQFIFRNNFVKLKSSVDKLLGKTKEGDVFYGHDGYLIQDFTKPDKSAIKLRLNSINSFFKRLDGAKKYVLVAPTSIDILKDKLPTNAPIISEDTYIDKIKNGLQKGISFVDTRDILKQKSKQYIYYKTDHHWTTKGAYYAYVELCKSLKIAPLKENYYKEVPVTKNFYGSLYARSGFRSDVADTIHLFLPKKEQKYIVNYTDEKKKTTVLYDTKWLTQKDKYQIFLGGNHPIIDIKTTAKTNRTLLLIKDSYANSIIPFLIPHFSEIKVIDMRYFKGDVNNISDGISDVAILYNIKTFFDDNSLIDLGF